ncbi:MAG: DUF401 family protein [Desulfobacteraceae bacterium]|nr:MAG: DUF401 family protein [Desulfobacteraceae bacterium]
MLTLSSVPALIRVGLVFIAILIVIRKNGSLGVSFITGALLLSLFFGLGPLSTLTSACGAILHPKTWTLAIIISLILILSTSMEISGRMQKMLLRFQGLVASPRLNLIIFPALIGLLPMPGGTLFSAPMVKEISGKYHISPDRLSFINFWFRHIWEYWWPLYPGVLLLTALANIHTAAFIAWMLPMTVFALVFGCFTLNHAGIHSADNTLLNQPKKYYPFIIELTPILIVVFFGVGAGSLIDIWLPGLPVGKETGLILSLMCAILWVWRDTSMSAGQIKRILANRQLVKMMFLIVSIFIFKGILEDSQAVGAVAKELLVFNIPIFLIALMLPLLVGIITGITVAVVGTAFPIIIPLIHSTGQSHLMIPYMMISLTCGFIGVLLSPLHLCFILSNEFFHADMKKMYQHLFFPCLGMVGAGVCYFYLLTYWFV